MRLAWCIYCHTAGKPWRGRHFCPEESAALDAQDQEDEMVASNVPTVAWSDEAPHPWRPSGSSAGAQSDKPKGPTALHLALARAGLVRPPRA